MMQGTSRSISIIALAALPLLAATGDASAQKAKPAPQTRVYTIDRAQSQIAVVLAQEGLIAKRYQSHRVEVRSFDGRIEVSLKDESRVVAEVEAESKSLVNVDQGMSEFERKEFHAILNNTVIESDKFPKIKFVSVAISDVQKSGETRGFTLSGDLTLHGVTKRVAFPVSVTMTKEQLRATGEAKMKQSDFGMKPYSGSLGLIKIGDEVKVSFSIVAKAQ